MRTGLDASFRFHFQQVLLTHQLRLDQGIDRPDAAEPFAVCACYRFPVMNVTHEDAGAVHVLQSAAQRFNGGLNFVDDKMGLRNRVAATDQAVTVRGRGDR